METALLSITDSILGSVDQGHGVIVLLLDFTAAFDTIDHSVLMSTLEIYFGIKGLALSWIMSYITGRYFQVQVCSH